MDTKEVGLMVPSQDAPQEESGGLGSGYPRVGLLIDGEWIYDRPSCADIRNPSDESHLGHVPTATAEDLDRALRAAEKGFHLWRDMPPLERDRILLKAAALLGERKDWIARVITLEHGKPLADSFREVDRSRSIIEWDAGEGRRLYGSVLPSQRGMQRMSLRQPIGVVAAFSPWNIPLGSPVRKLAAALAAGCSVILKPAKETPASACVLAQCFLDAGVPAGVINIVFGDAGQISRTLVSSPIVRMVTATGSVGVGRQLSKLAAEGPKPVVMELGGHAPVLICEGADAAKIAGMAALAKVRQTGQLCVSPSRFIVHRSVYDAFNAAFASAIEAIRVGDGLALDTQMGPVVSAQRLAAMEAMVADARSCGGRVLTGGQRVGDRGYFFAPTILADLPAHASAMKDEPFGPLCLSTPVDSLDEAIALANSLELGLGAYAFTNSMRDADRLMRDLECGILSINHFGSNDPDTPFGGVKESGIGREGGSESLAAYTVTKTVLVNAAGI